MHPPALFAYPHAGFILMDHLSRASEQPSLAPPREPGAGGRFSQRWQCCPVRAGLLRVPGGADWRERRARPAPPLDRLPVSQCPGILGWCPNLRWERGSVDVRACWTLFFFDTMFGDPQAFGRQVHHLSTLGDAGLRLVQIALAMDTGLNLVGEDLIGRLDLAQVMTRMALLPAGLLPALLPQRFEDTHKAIRGRWQVTIVAILGHAAL